MGRCLQLVIFKQRQCHNCVWIQFHILQSHSFRLSRHLVFWLCISAWYLLLCGFPFFHHNFSAVLVALYSRLPVCIIATYITLYFLIPQFLFRKKYRQFIVALAVLSIVCPGLTFLCISTLARRTNGTFDQNKD